MKKIFVGLFFLFFLVFFPLKTFAQEEAEEKSSFEKASDDYQAKLQDYQSAHSNYVLKRTQYLRFKTLQSQQEAQEATVRLLQTRDDALIFYLVMLRERLAEAEGVSETRKSDLNVRISAELDYLNSHKEKIPSAGTLKDLEEDNKAANRRYGLIEPLLYEILAVISSGRIDDFEERLTDLSSQLNEKINSIKSEDREEYMLSDRQLLQLDRWVLEAENRILRTEEKQNEGEREIERLATANQNRQPLSLYNNAILRLNEAKQFLKEGGTFLLEIIREIKTKDG